jgi:hypothetical protein
MCSVIVDAHQSTVRALQPLVGASSSFVSCSYDGAIKVRRVGAPPLSTRLLC